MRRCGLCQIPPRGDDSLTLVQVNAGDVNQLVVTAFGAFEGTQSVQACRTCAAQVRGQPTPPDPVYPPGCQMPPRLEICGLCRLALRDGAGIRPMRLDPADVIDSLWEAYQVETEQARATLLAAAGPALAEYEAAIAPFLAKRDVELSKLAAEEERVRDEIFERAETEDEANRLIEEFLKEQEPERKLIHEEFDAYTAVPRMVMQTALSRAEFPYRKAAIAAFRKLEPQYRGHSTSAEPGLYASCDECVRRYRPRVVERLKRTGLVKSSVAEELVGGDMLM